MPPPGCVLARRLAESGASVILLEAGGPDRSRLVRKPGMIAIFHNVPALKKRLDWGYYTAPQKAALGRRIPQPRGWVLGGSGSINGMLFVRGNRKNYDDWAAAGKNGKMPDRAPTSSCRELMALLKRAPNPFVTELEQRVKLGEARAWGVQLAAGFSRDKALAMYSRAIKRLSAVIGDQDPSLLSSIMRNRGSRTFYQVRIGADTRPAADDLCNRIRRAGGACFVLRNFNVRG